MTEDQQAAHPQRILVGVYGSRASLEALRWAVAEARTHGGADIRSVLLWELPCSGLATSLSPEPYGLPTPQGDVPVGQHPPR